MDEPEDGASRIIDYDPETDYQPSAFRDIEMDKVLLFELTDREKVVAGVDLSTGNFFIGGMWCKVETDYEPKDLKLVFSRVKQRQFEADYKAGEMVAMRDTGITKEVGYRLGWRLRGSNSKKIIMMVE